MNFNIKSICFIFSTLFIMGCGDELTQDPITERSATAFYTNEDELESAIIGVYAKLQHGGLYGLDLIGAGEVPSDNTFEEVPSNDGARFGDLDEFAIITANTLVGNIWRQSYVAIQGANIVLNRISDISYEDDNTKNVRIGEMKFIRALMYFNLVRLYGDVPLVTQETVNPNDFFGQARESVTQIYTQIITDLTEAISVLPLTKDTGKPGKGAGQALLGKVYLTLGQFSDAVTQLQNVVTSGEYNLVADPNAIFGISNENNSEVLFAVQFASGLDGNSEGSPAFSQFSPSGTVSNAKGHNLPTLILYNMFETNDARKTAYLNITNDGRVYTNKFEVNPTDAFDGGSDYIVLRYSDVVLMFAEALNETGNSTDAVIYLNSIRTRAGLANTTASSQLDIKDAIQLERRFELIGEGHRWLDLIRTDKAISTMNQWFVDNAINITIDDHNLLFPIPQSQVDTDPAILQNPGY